MCVLLEGIKLVVNTHIKEEAPLHQCSVYGLATMNSGEYYCEI